jgi:hypothetical protein
MLLVGYWEQLTWSANWSISVSIELAKNGKMKRGIVFVFYRVVLVVEPGRQREGKMGLLLI